MKPEDNITFTDNTAQVLSDNIYHYLWDLIASLQLEPGDKLSEVKISREFNCSRVPVREAVHRLANEGCLEIYPKRGSYVAPIDLVQMEHIRYIREVIETRVIMDDFDKGILTPVIPILASLIERQRQKMLINDYRRVFELDNEFHYLFFSIDHKDFAFEYAGMNEINYYRGRLLTLKGEPKTNMINQHVEILDCIRKGDRERLNKCLVRHFRNITDVIRSTEFRTKRGNSFYKTEEKDSLNSLQE